MSLCQRAVLALAATVLAADVEAQESKPNLREYRDARGKVAIKLLAEWKVSAHAKPNEQRILYLSCEIPGERHDLAMSLMEVPGAARPLTQAFMDLPNQIKVTQARKSKVVAEPVPHVISDREKDPLYKERVTILTYRRFRCRGIHVYLQCHRDLYKRIRDQFFAGVQSITCSLPRWPELPKGYSRVEKDGIVYCAGPGVAAAAVKRVRKCAGPVQKDFVRFHGAISRPADEPAMIIIHKNVSEHAALDERASKEQVLGAYLHMEARRVMVAAYARPKSEEEGLLVRELVYLFFIQRYGNTQPEWAGVGEAHVAGMRLLTGKKLPFVTKRYKDNLQPVSRRLVELGPLAKADWAKYVDHARVYVMFFHAGPSAYRRAYKAMLEDLRKTGDFEGAPRRHLFTLDQNKLFKDVQQFAARKLKVSGRR
jgi:hypothetical protein